MKIVSIDHPQIIQLILNEFNHGVPSVLIQFNQVYALIAPSNDDGVRSLNDVKSRLENKFYSSLCGDYNYFIDRFSDKIPTEFHNKALAIDFLRDSFLRIHVTSPSFNSPTVLNGTHQTYISDNEITKLVIGLQKHLPDTPNPLFDGLCYNQPICSSANISGDKSGGITHLDAVIKFAKERQINLVIKNEQNFNPIGSYPIFELVDMNLKVVRDINLKKFLQGKENHPFYSKIQLT